MKYLSSAQFKLAAQKRKPSSKTAVKFTSDAPFVDVGARTFTFVFSDSGVDRDGDRLNAHGWDTSDFDDNPIVLFQHDANSPIGRASNLRVDGDRLLGDIEFADTELAQTVYELVASGFLKAVSVGFIPVKYEFSQDKERKGGIDYLSQKLLEVSVVSLPANPRALIEAQFRGIEVEPVAQWFAAKAADKATPATERAIYKTLINTRQMSEGDPSSGGFVINDCGRGEDEECGFEDPQECEVHRTTDDQEEKTLMAMTNAMKAAQAELKRLEKLVARLQKEAEEDRPEDEMDDDSSEELKSVHLKCGHAHVKAAKLFHRKAVEEHMEALKSYAKCFKDEEPDGVDEVEDKDELDGDEDEMADKRFSQILARARAGVR